MATSLSSVSLSTPSRLIVSHTTEIPKTPQRSALSLRTKPANRAGRIASSPSTPPGISEKVSESIKKAEEACAGDAVTGECAAAWDEVEELSAAASHARDKAKDEDPLEAYCKDNPETDECRTYED